MSWAHGASLAQKAPHTDSTFATHAGDHVCPLLGAAQVTFFCDAYEVAHAALHVLSQQLSVFWQTASTALLHPPSSFAPAAHGSWSHLPL